MKGRSIRFSQLFCILSLLATIAFIFSGPLSADSFDWGSPYGKSAGILPGGVSWLTSVKSQFGGTCWDFSSVGTMEAKYMLTRNSIGYQPDLSEQQLCWETNPDLGGTGGGMEMSALSYMTTHGVVLESVIPHDPAHEDTPDAYPNSPWPLTSVFSSPDSWTNHVFKGVSSQSYIPDATADLKAELKLYGPLLVTNLASNDLYSSPKDLKTNYRGLVAPGHSATDIDHAVVLVGYYDDPTMPTGGYWVIKNSWGTGEGNQGYDVQPYGIIEEKHRTHAEKGPVYYTGVMAADTWKGPATGIGYWGASDNYKANWASGNTWVNTENQATFDATASNRTISVVGTVVAHTLIINTDGYTFNKSLMGGLTVTGGGIQANKSVTINVPVTVGAPQTWTAAANTNLNITNAVHTIISNLTITGDGTTTIGGLIDGGGYINSVGAAPGTITKNGSGTLKLTGGSTYSVPLILSAGKLDFAQANGVSAIFSGVISSASGTAVPVVKSGAGIVRLTGVNTYRGETDVNAGTLLVNGALRSSGLTVVNAGGTLGGSGTVGQVQVLSGGHIAPGDGLGKLTIASTLNLSSGAKLDFDLDSTTASDEIYMPTTAMTLSGLQFSDFTFKSYSNFDAGTYTLIDAYSISGNLGNVVSGYIDGHLATIYKSGGDLMLSVAVPEPCVLVSLFLAAAGLMGYAFRRRK